LFATQRNKGGAKMEHSFNIYIAEKYGVNSAILLKNLYFWIEKNRANETNFYDGYFWTYNSKKAFAALFPYMTARQVDYALQKLIDEGIVITGNYNKVAYDRTLWYAITKKGYSILQNCAMENTKMENGTPEIEQPIPYSKPVAKTEDKKQDRKKESNYDVIVADLIENEAVKEAVYEFIKMRKLIKKPLTDFALKKLLNKLLKLSNDPQEQIAILEKSIMNNWQDIYPPKAEQTQAKQPQGSMLDDMQRLYEKYAAEEEEQ
jgi:hypothetical protein